VSGGFTPALNPSPDLIAAMLASSRHRALRLIVDPSTGDRWLWPAEQATHAEGARRLAVAYDRPPGEGDIVTDVADRRCPPR
jgi:hypothetical protein